MEIREELEVIEAGAGAAAWSLAPAVVVGAAADDVGGKPVPAGEDFGERPVKQSHYPY